jgi:hypothetical protein
MRTVNVVFEDREWKELERMKGEDSWHDAILKWSRLNQEEQE